MQPSLLEGIALSLPARTADDIRATAFPTPQGFDLMVDLPDGARTASFSLFNAAGQLIWNTIRERAQGRTNLTAATALAAAGTTDIYAIKTTANIDANTAGDTTPEMQIVLDGKIALTASDFIL